MIGVAISASKRPSSVKSAAAAVGLDQLDLKLAFQREHLFAHRGMREADLLRSGRETSQPGRFAEAA